MKTSQTIIQAKRIKLGIDVHADSYRVVRQIDDSTPQPAQKFTPLGFLLWAKKQLGQAEEVPAKYGLLNERTEGDSDPGILPFERRAFVKSLE